MNEKTFLFMLFNVIVLLASLIRDIYLNYNYHKKYKEINKKLVSNFELLEKNISSEKYEIVLKNYAYNIKTKNFDNEIFTKNRNKYCIFIIMKNSCDYFSEVYNDKNIYCNIRIKNNEIFNTIAHYRCTTTSKINQYIYLIDKNTDLINIAINNQNKFIISNINDYEDTNIFLLQNIELKSISKAIITIPLKNENKLLGCYSIYFSKPLKDEIKLSTLKESISLLQNKLSQLIKEYIMLNYKDIDPLHVESNIIENRID